jgi:hypothetical protein
MTIIELLVFLIGRHDGELVDMRKLSERISRLERWQYWLKGGWAILAGAWGYMLMNLYGK